MDELTDVICPYCGEQVELYVDPDTAGELVQDCDVCCHPWRVIVERDASGGARVWVERAQ